jgi:hypothetical protein
MRKLLWELAVIKLSGAWDGDDRPSVATAERAEGNW